MSVSTNGRFKNRLLAAISIDDFESFFLGLDPVELVQRDTIFGVGDSIEWVYFIESGVCSVLTTMDDGISVEVGMVGNEGLVGLSGLLGGRSSIQHVIVQVPGKGYRLSVAAAKLAFDSSSAVRVSIHKFIDTFLNLSGQTAACNRLHTIEQRCARWMLMARDRVESDTLPMTHEFLATMLGVRRESVTQTARTLQRLELINYHHGLLTITNRKGLEALGCECYHIDHDQLFPDQAKRLSDESIHEERYTRIKNT